MTHEYNDSYEPFAIGFAIGDTVICVDSIGAEGYLIFGGVYRISDFYERDLLLDGGDTSWRRDRFEKMIEVTKEVEPINYRQYIHEA